MARVWEEANKRLAAERPNIEKEIEGNIAEAAKVQSATDRYFKAFEAGKLEASLCNEKVKALRAQLDALEASRKDLEAPQSIARCLPPSWTSSRRCSPPAQALKERTSSTVW